LTYLYISPRVILDANLIYGIREAKAVNPIYLTRVETDRWAASLPAFIPVKKFESSVLNVVVGGEAFEESANVAFYDSSVNAVTVGVLWRHIRK